MQLFGKSAHHSGMQVKTDIRNGQNLNMFLNDLGYVTWWDANGILNVKAESDKERMKLCKRILAEYSKSGWVPYHLSLSCISVGKACREDKVKFFGQATQIMEFRNTLGVFRIILFEGEDGNNYVWKCYTDNLPPATRRQISGNMVCTLKNGKKVMNLIKRVRTYDV